MNLQSKRVRQVVIVLAVIVAAVMGQSITQLNATEPVKTDATIEGTEQSVAQIAESSNKVDVMDAATDSKESAKALKTSASALSNRISTLENEGWVRQTKTYPSYIKLKNGDYLRYYFGSNVLIGEAEHTTIDTGNVQGLSLATIKAGESDLFDIYGNVKNIPQALLTSKYWQQSQQLQIPNVDYIESPKKADGTPDETATEKGTIVPHIYVRADVNSGGVPGVTTSPGLMVASGKTSRKASALKNGPDDFHLFEKRDSDGNIIKKIVYIAQYQPRYDTNYFEPNLLIETTMTPLSRVGRIKFDTKATNTSSETYRDFMLAYGEDTKLGTDDFVYGNALGGDRGFYIKYQPETPAGDVDKIYRLTYFMTAHDYVGLNGPNNWRAGSWPNFSATRKPEGQIGGFGVNTGFFNPNSFEGRYHYLAVDSAGHEGFDFLNHSDTAPKGPDGKLIPLKEDNGKGKVIPGQYISTWPENYQMTEKEDSFVSMKNYLPSFAPNETTDFSWLLGMEQSAEGPEFDMMSDNIRINQWEDVRLSGKWRDAESDVVQLSYKVEDGVEIPLGGPILNTKVDSWVDFSEAFKSEKSGLKIGENKVTLFAEGKINDTGELIKNSVVVTVYVNPQIKVNYLSNDGNQPITPPMGAPTLLQGKNIGETETFAIPAIGAYTFDRVEKATSNGTDIIATYEAANSVVTLYYESVPQDVEMTVNYYITGTTIKLKNINDGNKLIASIKQSVEIGKPMTDYTTPLKKVFDGYTYSQAADTGAVPGNDFEVNLYYDGTLEFKDVPATVDFGSVPLISLGSKKVVPTADVSVGILDTLENGVNWDLQVRVKEPLMNGSDALMGKMMFATELNGNLELTDTGIKVATKKANQVGVETVGWSKDKSGLYIQQEPGNKKGTYTGQLEWILIDGL